MTSTDNRVPTRFFPDLTRDDVTGLVLIRRVERPQSEVFDHLVSQVVTVGLQRHGHLDAMLAIRDATGADSVITGRIVEMTDERLVFDRGGFCFRRDLLTLGVG